MLASNGSASAVLTFGPPESSASTGYCARGLQVLRHIAMDERLSAGRGAVLTAVLSAVLSAGPDAHGRGRPLHRSRRRCRGARRTACPSDSRTFDDGAPLPVT